MQRQYFLEQLDMPGENIYMLRTPDFSRIENYICENTCFSQELYNYSFPEHLIFPGRNIFLKIFQMFLKRPFSKKEGTFLLIPPPPPPPPRKIMVRARVRVRAIRAIRVRVNPNNPNSPSPNPNPNSPSSLNPNPSPNHKIS